MSAHYLIAYDVIDNRRRRRVAKVAYALALGGQKSALESILEPYHIDRLCEHLYTKIKPQEDKINIIRVRSKPILLGRATQLYYDEGAIII